MRACVIAGLVAFAGHSGIGSPVGSEPSLSYVKVATVDGIGFPRIHVRNLLWGKNGIGAVLVRRRLCEVLVSKKDAGRALLLLRNDAQRNPYLYSWVKGATIKRALAPEAWPNRRFGVTLQEIDASRILAADPNLYASVREAVSKAGLFFGRTRDAAGTRLITVERVQWLNMRFVGDDLKMQSGCLAVVDVASGGKYSVTGKVEAYGWDDGREAEAAIVGDIARHDGARQGAPRQTGVPQKGS